ncbi:pyrimidine reductase family protein [Leucobacter sp. gxy201]|uniref:pyrimidine reductase family protein n=1 Tax=Leucobacter sp. gxy201 TaxID=2957200 RepID=UPI003D9FFE05
MPSTDELFEHYQYADATGGGSGRAHVRMNFITGADGAVAYGGRSGALGGDTDRTLMRVMRAMSDAVLVSAGTVRAEGYGGLTIPAEMLERRRVEALAEGAHPRMVIATNAFDLDPAMPVFAQAEQRPLILTSHVAAARRGGDFAAVADVLAAGDERLDIAEALRRLPERGLRRVLCEGGPQFFGALLEADLVDEVCLTIAPIFTAGRAGRIAVSAEEVYRRFELLGHLADAEGFLLARYVRR